MGIPFLVIKETLDNFGRLGPALALEQEFECVDDYHSEKPISKKVLYLCEFSELTDIEFSISRFLHPSPQPFFVVCVIPESECNDSTSKERAERRCALMTSESLVVAPFFTDLSVQRVRYHLQDRLVELTSWKYDMAEAMLSGAMFQEILDMSVDIVPNPIYVTDARYALVASVNTEGEKLPAFRELLDKGFLGKSTLGRLRQEGYISANAAPRAYQARLIASRKKDELPGESYVNHVFRVEGSFYLHVVMLCREKPLSPGLRYVFDVLCESINHCVMKECYQLGGRTRPENDLVLALVRGEEVDSDILDAYAKSNGVGLQEHFQLIQANNIGKVSMGMLLGMVEEIVPRGLMGQAGGSLYVLANCEEDCCSDRLRELRRVSANNKVCFGISLPFERIEHAYFGGLQTESLFALPDYILSGQKTAAPRSWVASFKMWARLCLLHASAETRDEIIGFLAVNNPFVHAMEHDAKEANSDMKLVTTFLSSSCNASDTARAMGVHRNSVYYGIARIKKRYGIDLNDEEDRQYCSLLLDAMSLMGVDC